MSDTALSQEVVDLEVADFDFDGDLDLVFLTDSYFDDGKSGMGFRWNRNQHTFDLPPLSLRIADINGDKNWTCL